MLVYMGIEKRSCFLEETFRGICYPVIPSQVALVVKNLPANAGDKRCRLDPWVRKMPWRRKWQPTPVFLPGKCHGQRSLVDYSPWGRKELDMTEATWQAHVLSSEKLI